MADRMVYVVAAMPTIKGRPTADVITDAQFAELLGDGWEVVSQADGRQIPWDPAPKKPVVGERVILRRREENRGLALAGDAARPERLVTLRDDYGRQRSVGVEEALGESLRQVALSLQQQSQGAGHLGAPGRHDLPGVTVISGEVVAKAFDLGLQAGIAGVAKSANPFPRGTDAHTLWLNGYAESAKYADQKPGNSELERAYAQGKSTAQRFGPDDEVTCPYRGALKLEWERGYKDGGGTFLPPGG